MRFILYLHYLCVCSCVFLCICIFLCVLVYLYILYCSGSLVQLMFAAACGRRPKLTSHFIVWSEGDEDADGDGDRDGGNRNGNRYMKIEEI